MLLLFAAFATIVYWTALSYYRGQTHKLKHIPSMTSDLPFLSYLGTYQFLSNTRDMINKSVKQWPGAVFKVPDLFQWIIVVTGSNHLEDIYKAPNNVLSSLEPAEQQFLFDYTFGPNVSKNPYHLPIIRVQLTRALPLLLPEVYDEVVIACNEFIPITEEWQSVRVMDKMKKVVCRASNRIFVGLPLCRNSDFVNLNVQYTVDLLKTSFILRMIPDFLKPIVNSLISVIPKRIEHAQRHLAPIIQARRQDREQKGHEKPLDFLTWLMDEARGDEATGDRDLTLRILTINFAAIHTSSMTFVHAFYYLATFPEYMQPLREEVEEVVMSEGWTKAGLDQMHKIDSFFKESQRLHPLSNLLLSRVALNDFTFSDGITIPRGTLVSVSSHNAHYNDEVYEDPLKFDGFRFSKIREESAKKVGMVSSSPDHFPFGHGRHVCPGRYFAACQLKLIFAHIVTTYDVKLEIEGVRPPDKWVMSSCLPNPNANVLFRKRAIV